MNESFENLPKMVSQLRKEVAEIKNLIQYGVEEKIYTSKQVMDLLSISKSTLFRQIREGEISFDRIGRAYRFKHSDVEKFLNSGNRQFRTKYKNAYKRINNQ